MKKGTIATNAEIVAFERGLSYERKRCADLIRDVELRMTRSAEDVDTRALLVDLADRMEAGT